MSNKQEEICQKENYKPYLDYGFVGLIEYMGSDESIEFSARMSYGDGTRTVNDRRNLIRYLIRHEHSSPVEQGEVRFHLKMPIAVARQFLRHRTACIAGDQRLIFDLGDGSSKKGKTRCYPIKIKDFHDGWHYSGYGNSKSPFDLSEINPDELYNINQLTKIIGRVVRSHVYSSGLSYELKKAENNKLIKFYKGKDLIDFFDSYKPDSHLRKRFENMRLRCVDESTGEIIHTRVKDVWESGVKRIYKLTLDNGKTIRTSKDHLFLTNSGWQTLEKSLNITFHDDGRVKTWEDISQFATNGIPVYQSEEWLREQVNFGLSDSDIGNSLGVSSHTIKKWRDRFNVKIPKEFASKRLSEAQIGKKRRKFNVIFTEERKQKLREYRSGHKSNFWKGGVCNRTKEDMDYDQKWRNVRNECLNRDNYTCQITGKKGNIHVHHIVPRWMDENKIFDLNNLICLDRDIHKEIHSKNLEMVLKEYIDKGMPLETFLIDEMDKPYFFAEKQSHMKEKTKGRVAHNKLTIVKFANVKSIEYDGEEMTYDIEVDGPWHNFSCEGVIVHNSVNELSQRYSKAPEEIYIPDLERIQEQSETNKQCSGELLPYLTRQGARDQFINAAFESMATYNALLDEGVTRELARGVLSVHGYTEIVWKIDLRNFLHFCRLRLHKHAQKEIRQLAQTMYDMVKPLFPIVCEAWEDYQLNGRHFSRMEVEALVSILKAHNVTADDLAEALEKHNVSKREINEFTAILG